MIRTAVVGLGYFSQYHLRSWKKNENTILVAACDTDKSRRELATERHDVTVFSNIGTMLAKTSPDILDIVAPPSAHAELISAALAPGRLIICQKPFCTSIQEAKSMIARAQTIGAQIIVHENFRFQPWYREVKNFLKAGRMGGIYGARFDLRPGDGRGPEAYLERQPHFQTMPRLLIHETAVHFIDLFQWLLGDITAVYADLRRLNPTIAGEDAGIMILHHAGGALSLFDGNRLVDHTARNPRKTMGAFEITGEAGTLSVDGEGVLRFRAFHSQTTTTLPINFTIDEDSFGGGCVDALISHAVNAHMGKGPLENKATDYLSVMRAVEAAYQSAEENRLIHLPPT